MASRPPPQTEAGRILTLARRDGAAARKAVEALDVPGQIALFCETPVAHRAEILDLLPAPEAVIPALPEAELCFTAKAIGLADAGALLEHATGEQLQACLDLDAWRGHLPDHAALSAWFDACLEAGTDTALRAVEVLDMELLVLMLQERAVVHLKTNDDDWQPPGGGMTLEGVFYLVAKRGDDDLETLMGLLQGLFERDYWHYFRLMQGAIHELPSDCEEFALRWRTSRLMDMGFPTWEEAMAVYGSLRDEELTALPEGATALDVTPFHLPVWMPDVPATRRETPAVLLAAAELDPDERRSFLYAFLALANKVAVADRMPLGDSESTPRAIDKAATVASAGLLHLAEHHELAPVEVLRRVRLDRLFRVGASLDRSVRPQVGSAS
jgi:hypothetical protein